MIRVLLADDEPMILKGLRKLIDWNALGFDIIGNACDGRELMELMEALQPDVIISDISMPHFTGIDMIRRIYEEGLPIEVIFISAFQEFTYARDAVAYGALDYLVKPIIKQQLESVLCKAAFLINEHQEEAIRKGKLQQLEHKIRQGELESWLAQLMEGTLQPGSAPYRHLAAELPGPLYSTGVVLAEQLSGDSDKWNDRETKLVEFAVGNILQEVVRRSGTGHVFVQSGRFCYVACHEGPEGALELAQDVQRSIRTYLKLSVTIGTSPAAADFGSLPEACRQAEQALGLKYFDGPNRIYTYRAMDNKPKQDELYRRQLAVVNGFTDDNWEAVAEGLERLLSYICVSAYGSRSLAVSTAFSSVLLLAQELGKSGLSLPEASLDAHDVQRKLEQCGSFAELRRDITDTVERMFRMAGVESGNKDKALLAKVKQYIEEHYPEEITLESAAGMTFMNPSYFSFFFKKQTGINFKQYVTGIRMKHAVRLLLYTDLMVYEIAEAVGYNNARHFSDIFRKTYGSLPNEYRQDKKRKA